MENEIKGRKILNNNQLLQTIISTKYIFSFYIYI